MLKKVLVAVGVVVAGLLVLIATRPGEYRVERSIVIATAAEVPFGMVNDFREWQAWSPWEKIDPEMERTHEGADAGEGARYAWAGNDEAGKGRMTIVSSRPHEAIDIELEFIEPFTSTAKTEFRFVETDGGTEVIWAMGGENDFMGKAFSLVMNMDDLIGADFEKGLASMKALAETPAES
jgi:hypothetical protein